MGRAWESLGTPGTRPLERLGPESANVPVRAFSFLLVGLIALLPPGAPDRVGAAANVREAQLLRRVEAHMGAVPALALSPDGQVAATGGVDGFVRLWTADGRLLRTLRTSRQLGPDDAVSTLALSADRAFVAAGRRSGALVLWDAVSRRDVGGLPSGAASVTVAAVGPGARTVAFGRWDGSLSVWAPRRSVIDELARGAGPVSGLALAPGAPVLAAAWSDGRVELWDTAARRLLWRAETGRPVSALTISPDGTRLAGTGAGSAWVRELTDGRELHAFTHVGWAQDISFSPDGAGVSAATASEALVWRLADGRLLERIRFGSEAERVAFAPGRNVAALTGSEGELYLLSY